jgi:hypothetical protein
MIDEIGIGIATEIENRETAEMTILINVQDRPDGDRPIGTAADHQSENDEDRHLLYDEIHFLENTSALVVARVAEGICLQRENVWQPSENRD